MYHQHVIVIECVGKHNLGRAYGSLQFKGAIARVLLYKVLLEHSQNVEISKDCKSIKYTTFVIEYRIMKDTMTILDLVYDN